MFFNLWSWKNYIFTISFYVILLIIVLFLLNLILINFIKKILNIVNKKNKNNELILKIEKLDNISKFNKLCKHLNLNSSYEISDFVGKDIKMLNYKQINNLIIKKLLW